jgi:hypothetical protein
VPLVGAQAIDDFVSIDSLISDNNSKICLKESHPESSSDDEFVKVVIAATKEPLMELCVVVNGVLVVALIDSGASVSIIKESVFKDMSNNYRLVPRDGCIYGIGGKASSWLGALENSEINFDHGPMKSVDLIVVPNDKLPGYEMILGLDFLRKNKMTVDLSRNRLVIPQSTLPESFIEIYVGPDRASNKVLRKIACEVVSDVKLVPATSQLVPILWKGCHNNNFVDNCNNLDLNSFLFEMPEEMELKEKFIAHTGILTNECPKILIESVEPNKVVYLKKGHIVGVVSTIITLEDPVKTKQLL